MKWRHADICCDYIQFDGGKETYSRFSLDFLNAAAAMIITTVQPQLVWPLTSGPDSHVNPVTHSAPHHPFIWTTDFPGLHLSPVVLIRTWRLTSNCSSPEEQVR